MNFRLGGPYLVSMWVRDSSFGRMAWVVFLGARLREMTWHDHVDRCKVESRTHPGAPGRATRPALTRAADPRTTCQNWEAYDVQGLPPAAQRRLMVALFLDTWPVHRRINCPTSWNRTSCSSKSRRDDSRWCTPRVVADTVESRPRANRPFAHPANRAESGKPKRPYP